MKNFLHILAFLSGSSFGLALALFLSLFGYQNIILEFILVYLGFIFLFIFAYGLWKTREINKINITKKVILWVIHNFRFLLVPGFHLDNLDERKRQHELLYPKTNHLHKYKSALFIIGICLITILCTIAVFQNWVSPYTYMEITTYTTDNYYESFAPPSPEHLLGQTFLGYDILARLIFGTRPVLVFTLIATFFSCLIGILVGALSGFYEGWVDALLMRIMDIILSFPTIVFAIIFITIWGRDFEVLIIIYSIIGVPFFARIMRTNVIREKVLSYIPAGRVSGAKNFRILFKHILPNCLQSVIVGISYNVSRNILSLAVLGFLRYGGTIWVEWGYDISLVLFFQSRLITAPWAIIFPCLAILIAVVGFLLLGDSLSDVSLLKKERL